jgi:hypothetical protein
MKVIVTIALLIVVVYYFTNNSKFSATTSKTPPSPTPVKDPIVNAVSDKLKAEIAACDAAIKQAQDLKTRTEKFLKDNKDITKDPVLKKGLDDIIKNAEIVIANNTKLKVGASATLASIDKNQIGIITRIPTQPKQPVK